MFYATSICAKSNIEVNPLDIHSKVVIYFLTKKEFKRLCSKNRLKMKEVESENWIRRKVRLGRTVDFLLSK